MKNTFLFCLLLLIASSCQEAIPTETNSLGKEIEALKTVEDKRKYLEQVYNDDQQVRNGR